MGVNAEYLNKLENELEPFATALKEGRVVEVFVSDHEGWAETKQLHTYKNASDYRLA